MEINLESTCRGGDSVGVGASYQVQGNFCFWYYSMCCSLGSLCENSS